MLKIGTTNYVSTATASATNTNPSFSADNIKTPTLKRWQSSSSIDTLTINLASAQDVSLIALFNVSFSTLTAVGKLATATVFTDNLTASDLDGVDTFNVTLPSTGEIDELVLTFDGDGDVPYCGYVHIGDCASFSVEDYQPFLQSTAQAETTVGGVVETNPGYAYRTFNVTVGKVDYTYAQAMAILKPILRQYSYPRAFVFDADCTMDEVVLGVLDSDRIGLDRIDTRIGGKYTVQFTIGITEIFAGELR